MSANYPGPYDQYANSSWDKAQQPRGLDTPVQEILKFQQRQLQNNPGRAYMPQNQQVNYNPSAMQGTAPDPTQLLQQAKIILAQANPQLASSANSTNANNQAFRLLQQLTQQPQPYQQTAVGVGNRGVFGQQPTPPMHAQYDQRALQQDYLTGRPTSTPASLYGQTQPPNQTQARALQQYAGGYDDPRNLPAQLSNYQSLSSQSGQSSLFSSNPSSSNSRQQGQSSGSSNFSSSNSSSRGSNSNSSRSSTSNRDRPRNNNNSSSSNSNSNFRGGRNDDNNNNSRRNDRRDDTRRDDRRDDPPRREPERAKSPKKETRKRKASPPPSNNSNNNSSSSVAKSSKPPPRLNDNAQKTEFHHSFAVKQIDFLQLKQRHRKLHIPKDFTYVDCICAELNGEVPTNFYIDVDCANKKDENSKIDQILKGDSEAAATASDGVIYTSKLMLFAGYKQPHGKSNSHLSNQLKFIVGKKDRSELFCIGGAWSRERDGGDPSIDRSVLKATATHYFKEFTGVDLSVCKDWIHFMDVHYQRPTGSEISVIWIPCIWQSPLLNNIVSNLAAASSKDQIASSLPSTDTPSVIPTSSPVPSSSSTDIPSSIIPSSTDSTTDPTQSITEEVPSSSTGTSSPAPTSPIPGTSSASTMDDGSASDAAPSTLTLTDAPVEPIAPSTDVEASSASISSIVADVPTSPDSTREPGEASPEPDQGESSSTQTGELSSSKSDQMDLSVDAHNSEGLPSTGSNNPTETAADQSSETNPTNNTNISTTTKDSLRESTSSSSTTKDSLRESSSSLRESSSSSSNRSRINLVTNAPSNVKLKPMSLSLHGLLEYDETDVFEKTFEVSLFGELFNDMLKREFGATILHALDLYIKRRSNSLTSNEPPPSKKQKLDEADTISSNTNEVASEEKPLLSTTEDTALLRAMDFFDKHGHGYLRPDEMETILYCLGKNLCKRVVEELVDKVIDPDSGRILYKRMIEDRTLFGHEQI